MNPLFPNPDAGLDHEPGSPPSQAPGFSAAGTAAATDGGFMAWIRAVVFAGHLAIAATASADPAPASRMELMSAPLPAYPAELKNEPVYRGSATVGCVVAPDGTVTDAWALRASHRAFAKAAEESVRTWRYAPATNPKAPSETSFSRVDVVQIHFTTTGSIISQTQWDAAKSIFPSPEQSLPPVFETLPAGMTRPARLTGTNPKPIPDHPGGKVVVEFFIDAEGQVRLPVPLGTPPPELAQAAVAAVRNWRFAAPRVDDKPASIRVRWNFSFPKADS